VRGVVGCWLGRGYRYVRGVVADELGTGAWILVG
jgi:hypothetical protein